MAIVKGRKRTKFQTCKKHASLNGETRSRRAEFFVEGGPAGQEGCSGGVCRLWPGTDMFDPAVCDEEMTLDWTTTQGSTVAGVASDGSLVVIAETRRVDL